MSIKDICYSPRQMDNLYCLMVYAVISLASLYFLNFIKFFILSYLISNQRLNVCSQFSVLKINT